MESCVGLPLYLESVSYDTIIEALNPKFFQYKNFRQPWSELCRHKTLRKYLPETSPDSYRGYPLNYEAAMLYPLNGAQK